MAIHFSATKLKHVPSNRAMRITTLIETSSLSSILNTHHVELLTFNNKEYNYKLFSNGPSVDSRQWKTFNNKKCNYKHFTNGPSVDSRQWKTGVSFFQGFLARGKDVDSLKDELFEAIAPLDRGALATPEDQQRIDQIARSVEAVNQIKEPLKSNLLNGKWELLYTTSQSILQTKRPKFLRPNGKIYQAINVDTLRAQNLETWPFFNQVTANLVPLNEKRVAVKFDFFRIAGLIPIQSPGSGRGQLEITYLDEELRISRGNRGNLFLLKMVDPSYRVPL